MHYVGEKTTGGRPSQHSWKIIYDKHQKKIVVVFYLNSSPPAQYGRHFADDIFVCIFLNENLCILIKISLKFVLKDPMDNNPVLV